jgi:dienelactone hydrolase
MKKILFISLLTLLITGISAQVNTVSEISFSRDEIILHGRFFKAEGTGPFTTVIILPGFPGNPTDVLSLGRMLSQNGINVITFNYCGTYQSQGEFSFEKRAKRNRCNIPIFLHKKET